jgi:hypothetical protein
MKAMTVTLDAVDLTLAVKLFLFLGLDDNPCFYTPSFVAYGSVW